jgi:hypothetical protein
MALHNVLLHRLIEEWNHSALGGLLASMLNDPRMQTTTAHNILILSRIVSFNILRAGPGSQFQLLTQLYLLFVLT